MVLRALMDFAASGAARLVNVRYADLMGNAVATTRSVYEGLEMSVPEDLDERIMGYLREQRSGKRAAPPERLETFGYQADAVWSDPTMIEYCESFGVERERSRMVDTRTGS